MEIIIGLLPSNNLIYITLNRLNNISLPLDIKILFETVIKVFKHEGIGQGEQRPVSLHIERKGKELR